MATVAKSQLSYSVADSLFNDIVTKTSRYYYTTGRILPWPNNDTAEEPLENYAYDLATRNEVISYKLVKSSDVAFVVPRYDWKTGQVFDEYDDSYSETNLANSGASTLLEAKFYVVTDSYNVYKCINNSNGSISTVKPVITDPEQFSTSDGYVWKFMYNIPIALRNKFMTSDYIPVSNSLKNRFYSNGAITSIFIDNPGSDYTTASIVVNGDGYQESNPYIIASATVLNGGSGYTGTPTITISEPSAGFGSDVQAEASSTTAAGEIDTINIDVEGYGYNNNATIDIAPPFVADEWEQNTVYTDGLYLRHNNYFYEVDGTGSTGPNPPVHTVGTQPNGTVNLIFVGEQAFARLNFVKTEAILTPVIEDGQITEVIIDDPGVGYSAVSLSVIGDGTDAALTADTSIGSLDTLQSNVELLATNGSIDHIKVTNGGTGYSSATIIIEGNGTGATAEAVIESGSVIGINVINRGLNYTQAVVSIVGTGTGATARAVISPIGGHGRNAISELNAKQVMLFSILSNDKLNGLTVNNDYRQVTIIRNPTQFGSNKFYRNDLGTPCYIVEFGSGVDAETFSPPDTILTTISGKTFQVVSVQDNKILLHSSKGSIPVVGEQLRNPNLDTLIPASVINPTIDRYSGDMLYIDNRSSFVSTTEQTINLRTVIEL